MLAYMNSESLSLTLEQRQLHFWSRSRKQLWRKGESSGNVLELNALRYDCDRDTLLALVQPAGPTCHTGERSCFFEGELLPQPNEALAALERVLTERDKQRPAGSYTTSLLTDEQLRYAKVIEEAHEVIQAAEGESDQRLAEETADLLYHLAVVLQARGHGFKEAFEVLNQRRA